MSSSALWERGIWVACQHVTRNRLTTTSSNTVKDVGVFQMTCKRMPSILPVNRGGERRTALWAQRRSRRGSGAVVGHRLLDATAGHLHRHLTWEDLLLLYLRQHLGGIGADLLGDRGERLALGAAVIFHGSTDDTAGIGDEVRDTQDAMRLHPPLCGLRGGNVGPLEHELRLHLVDILGG